MNVKIAFPVEFSLTRSRRQSLPTRLLRKRKKTLSASRYQPSVGSGSDASLTKSSSASESLRTVFGSASALSTVHTQRPGSASVACDNSLQTWVQRCPSVVSRAGDCRGQHVRTYYCASSNNLDASALSPEAIHQMLFQSVTDDLISLLNHIICKALPFHDGIARPALAMPRTMQPTQLVSSMALAWPESSAHQPCRF